MKILLSVQGALGPLAGLALLSCAGCVAGDPGPRLSLEETMARPNVVAVASAPSRALAALPEDAGRIEAIRDGDDADTRRQEIDLAGSAIRAIPNAIIVEARRADVRPGLDATAALAAPTEASIAHELARQFDAIPMRIVTRPSTNPHGPYGLALGLAAGGIHCLYAWQWIDDPRSLRDVGFGGPVSVRIRMCRTGRTFDAMAGDVDHLALGSSVTTPVTVIQGAHAPPARRTVRHHTIRRALARRDADPGPRAVAVMPGPDDPDAVPAKLRGDLPPRAFLGPRAAATPVSPHS